MGEYVTLKNGESIKIGTCESMYYMRADQTEWIKANAQRGGLPFDLDRAEEYGIRFRFPFPDEDHIKPGGAAFEDFERRFPVPGYTLPADFTGHYTKQFRHETGRGVYLASLPCPISPEAKTLQYQSGDDTKQVRIHPNGMRTVNATIGIQQQRPFNDGELWTVVGCLSCGAAWRLPFEEAEKLALSLRSYADSISGPDHQPRECHLVADRVLAGYRQGRAIMEEADRAAVEAFNAI